MQCAKTFMMQVARNLMCLAKGHLKIDSFSCTVKAAVADLMIDGVLGLDFLTGYNCSIDLRKQEITIGDYDKFQMVRKGHFGCFRVSPSENLQSQR